MINDNRDLGGDNNMNIILNPKENPNNPFNFSDNKNENINSNNYNIDIMAQMGNNSFSEKPNITLDNENENNFDSVKNSDPIKAINNPEKPNNSPFGVINMPSITSINQEKQEEDHISTLDEPIIDTLKRDLFRIYNKIKHVAVPTLNAKKVEELHNWDLWGPLIFCFLLSIALSTGDHSNDESSIFVLIFVIFWIGGIVVTFNGKFLGAKIGVCQMICLLGYCMFPITIVGMIIGFCGIKKTWVKTLLVFISLIWSCLASVGFVSGLVKQEKKVITVIPIFLFFLALGLFVLNY